uniref:Conotoxin n=1 Tax=Conus andremenezi TaxID=1077466 RepID=A0A291C200_9COND|nr:conotoxin [Conus andremenezi]
MKLTYALILAMLFLTACQLITTHDSRGRQEYRAANARTKMQNYKIFRLTKGCVAPGGRCTRWHIYCCSKVCKLKKNGNPVCVKK